MTSAQEIEEVQLANSPPSPVSGIDAINLSLRALWNYKSSATYKDLATPTGLHPTSVSQALSAAKDIGLTEYAGKRGLYTFTTEGKEYTRLLTGGAEAEAKDRLRLVVLKNPRWDGIASFLRTNLGIPRPPMDIVIDVERRLGKQWSTGMRFNVAQSIVSILEYAGLVKNDGGKIVSLLQDSGMEQIWPTSWPANVIDRASVRDPSINSSSRGLIRTSEPVTPPGPDFADYKDQNVIIRVRKDLQSINSAKLFLDFLEQQVKIAQKTVQDASQSQAAEHHPSQ